MPRPKGCKCGVLKPGEICPVHPDRATGKPAEPGPGSSAPPTPSPGTTTRRPGKRKPDPAPSAGGAGGGKRPSSGKPKPGKAGPTDQQLEDALRKVLKACTIPMRFKCDYCANHMSNTAAIAAKSAIEDNDLRDLAAQVYVWCNQYAGAGWLAVFIGVPLLHHAAPEFAYRPIAPLIGMPPRPPKKNAREHRHPHPEPAGAPDVPTEPEVGGGGEPPPVDLGELGGMFAGMDIDQLLDTARTLGIELSDDELAALTVHATHAASEPPTATVSAEPAEADADGELAEAATAATVAALADPDAE